MAAKTKSLPLGARGPAARPAILDLAPTPLIVIGLALAGVVLITVVHEFRMTASVLFLDMGWLAIVGSGVLLWRAGLLVAAGDQGDDGSFDAISSRTDELKAEKASLLKAIKEVDFDRMMGKLSQRDADEITNVYRRRAILLLKELDHVDATVDIELSAAERIERDLRARAALTKAGKGTERRVAAEKKKAAIKPAPEPAPPPPAAEEEE